MKDTTDNSSEMGSIYISSEQIIAEVQKFRCLYDPSDPEHKDRDVMRDAWLSVTSAVVGEPWQNLNSAEKNEAENDLRRKWKYMRDAFVKCLKKGFSVRPSTSGRIEVSQMKNPYAHFKQISFLLETDHYQEFLKNVQKQTNVAQTVGPGRSDEVTRSGPGYRIIRYGQNNRSLITSTPKDNTLERDDSSTSCQSSYSASHHKTNPEPENPDRMFLLSLLPRVSALNSRDKMDFQIGIMQLLQGYETEESNS